MISGLIRERKRPVQNLLFNNGASRTVASLYSKSTSEGRSSVLIVSSMGRESFRVRAVLQMAESMPLEQAEKLVFLISKNWSLEPNEEARPFDFHSSLGQEELADLVYEHLIFLHDLMSTASSPLAAYKFTAMAFQMMSGLGIKKPIQALAVLHGSTLTAINRRLASARNQGLIPSPRKER